jgi:hypothetical protein
MERTTKITTVLTLVMAFCFVLVSLAQAQEKAKPLMLIEHKPNPRFAILDPCSPEEEGDDLVLDKKTGLVWARNAHLATMQLMWDDAGIYCQNLTLGNHKGWRLPTKEELSSLVDASQEHPSLPKGHPFSNVKFSYWSSTTYEADSDFAWHVSMNFGFVGHDRKTAHYYMWPILEKY